mgnify:CR=1 FL=1
MELWESEAPSMGSALGPMILSECEGISEEDCLGEVEAQSSCEPPDCWETSYSSPLTPQRRDPTFRNAGGFVQASYWKLSATELVEPSRYVSPSSVLTCEEPQLWGIAEVDFVTGVSVFTGAVGR